MKNTLLGLVIGFGIFAVLSYKTTQNEFVRVSNTNINKNANIPLKQRNVMLVYSQAKASQLQKKGWIVQDVDITFASNGWVEGKIFTMILY